MIGPDRLIEVRGLCRYYGPLIALQGVDISLDAGELLLVLGANGAGKSTLLTILAGLLQPSAGEIRLDGTLLRRRKGEARKSIGYAGEQPLLYGDLTIEESLELIRRAGKNCPREHLEQVLEDFRLTDLRKRPLRQCSQGIRRRAGLARAFLLRPKLFLLDEPLANLDWGSQEELAALLHRERARGAAAIVAAHEDLFLRETDARVLFLNAGRPEKKINRLEDFMQLKERKR